MPARRSIRLPQHDYAEAGAYFVTICTHEGKRLLGSVANGHVYLSHEGRLVSRSWKWLEEQYDYVTLDEWVVMPNHVHGILVIADHFPRQSGIEHGAEDTRYTLTAPLVSDSSTARKRRRKTIGRLVGAFKTVSTKRINQWRHTPGAKVWQRNYYERVVRNNLDLDRIRQYIAGNPTNWERRRRQPPEASRGLGFPARSN